MWLRDTDAGALRADKKVCDPTSKAEQEETLSDFWSADYGGGEINVCVYNLFFSMAAASVKTLRA